MVYSKPSLFLAVNVLSFKERIKSIVSDGTVKST